MVEKAEDEDEEFNKESKPHRSTPCAVRFLNLPTLAICRSHLIFRGEILTIILLFKAISSTS